MRRVVELGRQARVDLGAEAAPAAAPAGRRGRAARRAQADEIADELRVKEVEFGEVEASELRVKPNLPVLGPKLGKELREVRARARRGRFEELDGGRFQVDGHVLEPDEVLVERDRPGGLGGRHRRRGHGRARHDARRRAAARGARQRPDPRRERAAQGERPRDRRPDPPLDPRRAS